MRSNLLLTQCLTLSRPSGYDMLRKLMLVGMLVIAGRGSVAQLFLALFGGHYQFLSALLVALEWLGP